MGIIWNTTRRLAVCVLLATAPAASNVQASEPDNMDSDRAVVIIGASYAQGWDINEIANLPVENVGIDGQESHELLQRFEKDVLQRHPEVVVIWGYINDIHRNPREDLERTKKRARDSFVEMIKSARGANIEPVVTTEVTIRPPSGWYEEAMGWLGKLAGKQSYQEFVNEQVRDLNSWLRRYAQEQGIRVLDFEVQLSDSDGQRLPEYATPDGSHISQAGYDRLTEYTNERLR